MHSVQHAAPPYVPPVPHLTELPDACGFHLSHAVEGRMHSVQVHYLEASTSNYLQASRLL